MNKAELNKIIKSIKVEDLKGKVLMFDESTISVEDIQQMMPGLREVGVAGVVILPAGAKYDVKTKEELKKMVEQL